MSDNFDRNMLNRRASSASGCNRLLLPFALQALDYAVDEKAPKRARSFECHLALQVTAQPPDIACFHWERLLNTNLYHATILFDESSASFAYCSILSATRHAPFRVVTVAPSGTGVAAIDTYVLRKARVGVLVEEARDRVDAIDRLRVDGRRYFGDAVDGDEAEDDEDEIAHFASLFVFFVLRCFDLRVVL
jgi:hypothetical protein